MFQGWRRGLQNLLARFDSEGTCLFVKDNFMIQTYVYIPKDGPVATSTLYPLQGDMDLIDSGDLTVLCVRPKGVYGVTRYGFIDLVECGPDATNMFHEPTHESA